jgi:hypothetical protein
MWVGSSDALSFFMSKRANNWIEACGCLQLFAFFDPKNERASEDETHISKRIIVYNYSVAMWLWTFDALSFFVSKSANNWRERSDFLQLLAVFDTKNESATEDQTHVGKRIVVCNYSVVMWVWSSVALSFFLSKRADNWTEACGSLQLLAFFDTKNENASED